MGDRSPYELKRGRRHGLTPIRPASDAPDRRTSSAGPRGDSGGSRPGTGAHRWASGSRNQLRAGSAQSFATTTRAMPAYSSGRPSSPPRAGCEPRDRRTDRARGSASATVESGRLTTGGDAPRRSSGALQRPRRGRRRDRSRGLAAIPRHPAGGHAERQARLSSTAPMVSPAALSRLVPQRPSQVAGPHSDSSSWSASAPVGAHDPAIEQQVAGVFEHDHAIGRAGSSLAPGGGHDDQRLRSQRLRWLADLPLAGAVAVRRSPPVRIQAETSWLACLRARRPGKVRSHNRCAGARTRDPNARAYVTMPRYQHRPPAVSAMTKS